MKGTEPGAVVPTHDLGALPSVQAPFSEALLELAATRPEIVVLSADLSKYTDVSSFAAKYPERFFQVGMAEQNMMGIAGGLAKTGFVPIPVTYCVFAARRALDQVEMALATGRHPVVVAAFLPGITTPFRASHQGTDDLAIMRAIPGMTVIDPLDATELGAALRAAVELDGPVYLRGLRGEVDAVLRPPYELSLAESRLLRDGSDVGLVGTGLGTRWALEAAALLEGRGVSAAVLHVPVLKPFDAEGVAAFAARFAAVMSVENHSVIGGLGSAVAEALAERGSPSRLLRAGVPDRWGEAGPLDYLRLRLGLDGESLARRAMALVAR